MKRSLGLLVVCIITALGCEINLERERRKEGIRWSKCPSRFLGFLFFGNNFAWLLAIILYIVGSVSYYYSVPSSY